MMKNTPKVEAINQSEQDARLIEAVARGSQAWKDAFNNGDAAAAAALYEAGAMMVAQPFGTFEGRDAIQSFWEQLIGDGFSDVVYHKTVLKILDAQSVQVSADWTMNKAGGIITNETWVLQPDGTAMMREDHFEAKN